VNALTGRDRLLVSEIAGTTRDCVEVPLRLADGLVHLVDTAGLGEAGDALDALAVDRTRMQLGDADLRIRVADGTRPAESDASDNTSEESDGARTLRVLTKCDRPEFVPRAGWLAVSSLTGEGLDALWAALTQRLAPAETAD